MTTVLVIIVAVMALPVLLLIGVALGPVALVAFLILACIAPPFLLAAVVLRHSAKS